MPPTCKQRVNHWCAFQFSTGGVVDEFLVLMHADAVAHTMNSLWLILLTLHLIQTAWKCQGVPPTMGPTLLDVDFDCALGSAAVSDQRWLDC